MTSDHLSLVLDTPPADLSRPGAHRPQEWIAPAIEATGTAGIRRRRLPAEQVVWLVIAPAIYRHGSISEVVDSRTSRQRLGDAPLVWLFRRTARAWCQQDAARRAFKGLSRWAMDGSTLRIPDSPPIREHFGAQVHASGKVARLPSGAGRDPGLDSGSSRRCVPSPCLSTSRSTRWPCSTRASRAPKFRGA